jgi:ligand-binding sensor domain-containing protein
MLQMILFFNRYSKLLWQTAFLLLLLCSANCYGQLDNPANEPIEISSKTGVSGPKSSVRCGLKDRAGNLWFGSWEGIFRYDGSSFTVYRQATMGFLFDKGENAYLDRVYCLFEDKAGTIWFGTQEGVIRYDGKSFWSFPLPKADAAFIDYPEASLSTRSVISIFQDTAGNLWFGTQGSGVYRYDWKSITSFTEKDGLCNNCVQSMEEDRNGNLLFGTRGGGLCCYDAGKFSDFATTEIQKIDHVFSIIKDRDKNLWISFTRGNVRGYDGNKFISFTSGESDFTSFFLEDRLGRFWLGNNRNEIQLYDGKSVTDFPFNKELHDKQLWFVLEDETGNFWFGTRNGLYTYDGEKFKAAFGS